MALYCPLTSETTLKAEQIPVGGGAGLKQTKWFDSRGALQNYATPPPRIARHVARFQLRAVVEFEIMIIGTSIRTLKHSVFS